MDEAVSNPCSVEGYKFPVVITWTDHLLPDSIAFNVAWTKLSVNIRISNRNRLVQLSFLQIT